MSASLQDVFDHFRAYDRSAYGVFACQGNEPSEQDMADFEAEIGFRLPEDFREFTMSPLGGLYLEVREEQWPQPKALDVGPFWTFLYGIKVFGISAEIPEWLDIRIQYRQFRDSGFGALVPAVQLESDADSFCLDRNGRILHWSHEEPEEPRPVELTFPALLMQEIEELEDRRQRKLRRDGG